MGAASLFEQARPVLDHEFNQPELFKLIENLTDTQRASGGVGIAAPQIGVNLRVVVIEYAEKNITRYANVGDCRHTVIINPVIELLDNELVAFNEGCLSVPGLKGEVWRAKSIRFSSYDQFGGLHQGIDDGFFARVLQHECDHLDGVLYPMRMTDLRKLAFIDAE